MTEILTVAQLTRQLKDCLEGNFPFVAVQGEVSSCTYAASGHLYFTLKDEQAQLRVVMWKRAASRLKFEITDGMEMVAVGSIELYAARGAYQLVAEELIPHGIGPLELAFRQLHERLQAEGLFDPARKRPLPRFPRRIAVITSPTGAAIRDILQVMTRRWPLLDVVLLPVAVQGDAAAPQIVQALETAPRIDGVDVVIAGRGGGSLEDLWAFNQEIVARAIAACPLPVVSAVGHEIDVTIADLVADCRALTPSEAGELTVPDIAEIQAHLQHMARRLVASLREQSASARRQFDLLASRRVLRQPYDRLQQHAQRLDEWHAQLVRAMQRRVRHEESQVARIAAALNALSPLKVLERGYSIAESEDTGRVLRSASDVATGDRLVTRLLDGRVISQVVHVEPNESQHTED
ncbi:MAG: exodeoxyribonuclease VII large subunit [Planctomycetaceae bacterium]|nr:exodeoxyribonuclease VII large subunit [Planctomycetaceae bacterium]